MSRNGVSRGLVGAAGTILLGTAVMHGIGYSPLVEQLGPSALEPDWLGGVKGLWIIFSLHLAILGVLFLVAAARPGSAGRGILAIAGLVPAGDTVMLLAFVGVFPGSMALGLATLCVFTGLALEAGGGRAGRPALFCALLAAGLLAGLGCARAEPPTGRVAPDATDLHGIEALREAYVKAHDDGDPARLAGLFTDDAVFIPADDATCEGKEEISDYLHGVLEENPSSLEFDVRETLVLGDWAFERIDVTVVIPDPVSREEWEVWVRYLWILKRQPGGEWKIGRLIYNIDESDGEEPVSEPQPRT